MKLDLSLKTQLGASAPFTDINNYSFKLNKNKPTTVPLQSFCFKLYNFDLCSIFMFIPVLH